MWLIESCASASLMVGSNKNHLTTSEQGKVTTTPDAGSIKEGNAWSAQSRGFGYNFDEPQEWGVWKR